ncbi:NUDIX hydrolase [Streptococcus sp. SG1]|jgi:MutT/NUDIX family protein|uniref:NUDIX hydrolase n=1 Tax=Streptococcus TaxID=1301 RepID=UPI0009C37633|nr:MULTISPECIES: NUDIX hydrolase [Streptococcus]ARC47181.1 NUDIX hydrolase [Streptococcus gordonii]MDN5018340.1 NUDIX hydrolase [Streptococcus sp. SG1]MDU3102747.1 NUDIX hydrolase [Streptococcus sp.]RSJ52273.1 ADP-ribose pyrophosphatase [Streptococcus gordonii]RSJ60662.1 ADP-ribose pyrophosphatase [Streptococcus gordonii]
MEFEEKTVQRTEIYQGPIFKVVQDQVELPEGKGQAQRDLIFHNGAVAVIALTPENKLILVKQYRKAIEATSYEIPAGKLEVGENADPHAAALRELEEETGYTGQLELVYDFYSAIGFCNEKIKLYKASQLTKVENPRPQDEDETLQLFEVSLEEANQLLQNGDICDAKTIMALQYWEMQENQR